MIRAQSIPYKRLCVYERPRLRPVAAQTCSLRTPRPLGPSIAAMALAKLPSSTSSPDAPIVSIPEDIWVGTIAELLETREVLELTLHQRNTRSKYGSGRIRVRAPLTSLAPHVVYLSYSTLVLHFKTCVKFRQGRPGGGDTHKQAGAGGGARETEAHKQTTKEQAARGSPGRKVSHRTQIA